MGKLKFPKLYYKFNNTKTLRVLKTSQFPKLADFLSANQKIIVDFFNETRTSKSFYLNEEEFDSIAKEFNYLAKEYEILFSSSQIICIIKKQIENI